LSFSGQEAAILAKKQSRKAKQHLPNNITVCLSWLANSAVLNSLSSAEAQRRVQTRGFDEFAEWRSEPRLSPDESRFLVRRRIELANSESISIMTDWKP
jgi:hypothetical protein